MIDTLEEAIDFANHPVRAYDPAYTKDVYLFRYTFDCFVHFIQESVLSNPNRKAVNLLHGLFVDLVHKVNSYERHSGVALFPTSFWEKRLFASLYSGDTLTFTD